MGLSDVSESLLIQDETESQFVLDTSSMFPCASAAEAIDQLVRTNKAD